MKQNDIRHLYLYAKGWYRRSDNIIDDLKVIVGKIICVYPEHVDVGNILYWLTKEIYKQTNSYDKFFNLISAFFPENSYLYKDEQMMCNDGIDITIRKCLSIMSLTSIDKIDILLGKPDKELLPLTDFQRLHDEIDSTDLNGLKCSICFGPQFDTPSGVTCKNGHGGVEGI
jgi:hypothetical protein